MESHPPLNIKEGLYGQYFTEITELNVGAECSQDESLNRYKTLGDTFDSKNHEFRKDKQII
jgi:hypothetical protein